MNLRPLSVALCMLAVAVPAAAGSGGPSPGLSWGSDGVAGPGGQLRYVALPTDTGTLVETIRVHDGRVLHWVTLRGPYGVPLVTYDGAVGGLSHDAKTLVLASYTTQPGSQAFTRFAVLDTRLLVKLAIVTLRGTFSYDALSPDASTLYLIQYLSAQNANLYRVRAYDLAAHRLLARVIADRREPKAQMTGQPMARVTSPDGGWVYTLYSRAGAAPFVHALDTRHLRAACLDLRWHGSQAALSQMRLALSADGRQVLLVRRSDGSRVLSVAAPAS